MRLIPSATGAWLIAPAAIVRLAGTVTEARDDPDLSQKLSDAGVSLEQPASDEYALTVLTDTHCNLGCGYCFQNTASAPDGSFRPPRIERAQLDAESIASILRFTGHNMRTNGFARLSILLFGGEPLLNPGGCELLLNQAADLGLTGAGLITNATLLTPRLAERLEERGLRWTQVTFDGARSVHNQIRATRGGRPTYDHIIANIEECASATDLEWRIRINVSHHNIASLPELLDDLVSRLSPEHTYIYPALVNDVGIGYGNRLETEDSLATWMFEQMRPALEAGFRTPYPVTDSYCRYCTNPNGRTGAVVYPDGRLYSCWESAGKPGFEVGTVNTGYLPIDDTKGRWVSCGYASAPHGRPDAERCYQDTYDGLVLDWLHTYDRLQPSGSKWDA